MGVHGGPKKTSSSIQTILFNYDANNLKSYAGEPTTNDIVNPDVSTLTNAVEGNYQPGWDATLHTKALQATNWNSYNSGVTNPTVGWHQHQIYGGCDDRGAQLSGKGFSATDNDGACFQYVDQNDLWSEGHRWMSAWKSIGTPTSLGWGSSDDITLSWWQRSNVIKGGYCGIYHYRVSEMSNGFEDAIQEITVTTVDKWERVSFTFTTTSNWDLTVAATIYCYGYLGAYGVLLIDNVQVEKKSHMTAFTTGTRSTTTAMLDPITGIAITMNSITYAEHPSFSFNGTSDYLTTGTLPSFTQPDEFSIEGVIKPSDFDTEARFITPLGLGIDRWIGINTSGKLTLQLVQSADTGGRGFASTATLSTSDYSHFIITVNGTDINFYINGVLDSNQTDSSGFNVGQWGGFGWYIGQRSNSTSWYTGEIPTITAYDGVLTASQVHDNFAAIRGQYGI